MCFGAAASVWNFNRVADALQLPTRMTLLIVGGHYVDDFNGLEYAEHTDSAFNAFSDFFVTMGLRVKESRAQKPQRQHVHVSTAGVTLSPTTKRVGKLRPAIRKAIEDDELDAGLPCSHCTPGPMTQPTLGWPADSAIGPPHNARLRPTAVHTSRPE